MYKYMHTQVLVSGSSLRTEKKSGYHRAHIPGSFQLEPRGNCPFNRACVPSLPQTDLPLLPYAWATSLVTSSV